MEDVITQVSTVLVGMPGGSHSRLPNAELWVFISNRHTLNLRFYAWVLSLLQSSIARLQIQILNYSEKRQDLIIFESLWLLMRHDSFEGFFFL